MDKIFRANATQINKKPARPRFLFIFDDMTSTVTFRTLDEKVFMASKPIRVLDMKAERLLHIDPDQIIHFLDEWRDNYHNYSWSIPEQYLLKK